MRRREFLALVGAVATLPQIARAQQAGKIPRVALVVHIPQAEIDGPVPRNRAVRAFLEGLRDRGWVDGQSIQIDRWSDDGRPDRIQSMLQEMVRLQVDAIVTAGGFAVRAAMQATSVIPIVMAGATLPVETGLIRSLARPGGNVTGLTFEAGGEIIGKRLELLKELAPNIARVGIIGCSRCGFSRVRAETEAVGHSLGLVLKFVVANSAQELEKALVTVDQEHIDAVFVELSPVNVGNQSAIIDFMARRRLPAVYALREDAESGGLMTYGVEFGDLLRRSAEYVDKILKGANPGELAVEQPTKFELVINLKTANAMGLTVPPTLLARADEVIE